MTLAQERTEAVVLVCKKGLEECGRMVVCREGEFPLLCQDMIFMPSWGLGHFQNFSFLIQSSSVPNHQS